MTGAGAGGAGDDTETALAGDNLCADCVVFGFLDLLEECVAEKIQIKIINKAIIRNIYKAPFFLSHITGKGDGPADDSDFLHVGFPIDERAVLRVFRLKDNMIGEEMHALERGLVVDKHGGDLPVIHAWLLADVYNIAVIDAGIDHAVPFAAKSEVGLDVLRHVDLAFNVLGGKDRLAAGDGADERDALHGGKRENVVGR